MLVRLGLRLPRGYQCSVKCAQATCAVIDSCLIPKRLRQCETAMQVGSSELESAATEPRLGSLGERQGQSPPLVDLLQNVDAAIQRLERRFDIIPTDEGDAELGQGTGV